MASTPSFTARIGNSRPWAPTDVTSAILLGCWDSDSLTGADASAIASWPDTSGNGRDMLQATGSKQPIVKTAIVNGHAVGRSDGVDDFMTAAMPGAMALPITVVTVVKTSGGAGRYAGIGGGFPRYGSGNTPQIFDGTALSGTANMSAAFKVVTALANGVTSSIRVNGVSDASGDSGASAPSSPANLFASDNIGAQAEACDIAFHAVFQGALSAGDQANLEGYLSNKYNLGFGTAPTAVGQLFDIAPYMRVTPGEGMDPANSGYLEPAFAESPLRDGGPLINIDAHNREMIFPLALSATTKDGLHALIQQLNNACQAQSRFEWKDQGATNSTWLDMQSGRLDIEYNFRRAQKFWCFATLHVWTTPFGHTGTQTLLGSVTSSGMVQSLTLASPVLGDMPALARWEVTSGSNVIQPPMTYGRYIGVAALAPSYLPVWGAGSIQAPAGAVLAASGAQGSRMWQASVNPTTMNQIVGQVKLSAAAYAGRNRVYAVGRSCGEPAAGVWLQDWDGQRVGATQIASGTKDWHLIDLGVFNVPTYGVPSLLTVNVMGNAFARSATIAANYALSLNAIASSVFQLNQIIVMPENRSALLTDDVDVPSMMIYDSFYDLANSTNMLAHTTETGHTWATSLNTHTGFVPPASLMVELNAVYDGVLDSPVFTQATAVFTAMRIPSIAQRDFTVSAAFSRGRTFVGFVPTQNIRVGKDVATDSFVSVNLNTWFAAAPTGCLFIEYRENGAAPSYLGSVAITFPSQMFERYRLIAQFSGATLTGMVVWDDPGASQTILATTAIGSLGFGGHIKAGDPLLGMRSDPSYGNITQIYDFRVQSVPSVRIAPRDVYVLDGINGEAWRRPLNSDISQRLTHRLRGQIPKVPQSTQIQSIMGFVIGLPESSANDLTDVSVSVREQFRFAR